MKWDPDFRDYLKQLDSRKPVILCGDLNVAHNPIDLKNPKTNTKTAGFTVEERDGMTALLEQGFVDTFRKLYPEQEGAYTYWSYLGNARKKNVGWFVFCVCSESSWHVTPIMYGFVILFAGDWITLLFQKEWFHLFVTML